jgi:hypothetical protein
MCLSNSWNTRFVNLVCRPMILVFICCFILLYISLSVSVLILHRTFPTSFSENTLAKAESPLNSNANKPIHKQRNNLDNKPVPKPRKSSHKEQNQPDSLKEVKLCALRTEKYGLHLVLLSIACDKGYRTLSIHSWNCWLYHCRLYKFVLKV